MNGFTEEGAAETLRAACRKVNLDPSGATLIRLGENAIFRLPSSNVIDLALLLRRLHGLPAPASSTVTPTSATSCARRTGECSSSSWHTEEEYRGFAAAYGVDVMAWPGFEVLRDIRELRMVAWLMQNVAHDPAVAAEFSKRISQVRDRAAPRNRRPF